MEGFTARHGEPEHLLDPAHLLLHAPDGARARIEVPFGPARIETLEQLVARSSLADDAAYLLLRRGGFAVGLRLAGTFVAHKVGTRYVQGRTAAGGWSQQRFARRRDGQTAALVGAAAAAARTVWYQPGRAGAAALVVGGDRLLVDALLADAPPELRGLPRSPLLDVADPRLSVLHDAARRARSVRIHLDEPG